MSHAQLKIRPGVDQVRTPALNEAAIQSSNLIRFMPDREGLGLVQKLGGWAKYYSSALSGIPRALLPWEDANSNPYVAIGTTAGLFALSNNNLQGIYPQYYTSDTAVNVSTTVGSSTVKITDVGSNARSGDSVYIRTQISIGGLILFGQYLITAVDADDYNITATNILGVPVNATSSVTNGGTVAKFSTVSGSTTVTVTLTNHNYSIGGFFPVLTPTSFNGITLSGNYVIQPQDFTANAFTINAATSANSTGDFYLNNGLAEYEYFIGNTTPPAGLGFGAGGFGTGGFGLGVLPLVGRSSSITNITPSLPTSGQVTYYFLGVDSVPVGSAYTVSGVTPSQYNTSGSVQISSARNSNVNSVVTITIASPAVVTWGGALPTTYPMALGDLVSFGTTGALPTGLTAGTNYYVRPINATTFNLSSTLAGALITTSGSQSGTHTAQLKSTAVVANLTTTGDYTSGGTITFTNYAARSEVDWTLANWGDILISCPKGGGIFQWEPGSGATTASIVPNSPTANDGIFIAMPQRQIVAWGSTFNGVQQPLLVRWCDANNFSTWIANITNQAGSYILPRGSKIVAGMQGPQQSLLWTDLSLWSMQYVSQPLVYGFNEIGFGCGLIGQKAAGSLYGVTYWMGPTQMFQLDGNGVSNMNCPVWDVVFQNLNQAYTNNIRFFANARFGEIGWYFPSTSSLTGENDMYVKYNTLIGGPSGWDYGFLNRSAWVDQSIVGPPLGTDSSGYIYQHEVSPNADGAAMLSSFRTGFFELSEAEFKIFVDQIWPDMKWGYFNGAQTASIQITFYVCDYPDGPISTYGPYTMTNTVTFITPRFRGRLVSIEISSSDLNSFWRLGGIRYRLFPDGKF